jgi:hypothetical protein
MGGLSGVPFDCLGMSPSPASNLCLTIQVIAIAILIIERPRAASMSLLILYIGLLLERLVFLQSTLGFSTPGAMPLIPALLGVVIVLNTPLRDPRLPNNDISTTFAAPNVELRTPEDNLTPWQYATVSWMSPLIAKGMTRKVEDEDVWDLGWEFKHARLHSAFRVLQGSVTKRLLVANGMDLVRTTILALIQLITSK